MVHVHVPAALLGCIVTVPLVEPLKSSTPVFVPATPKLNPELDKDICKALPTVHPIEEVDGKYCPMPVVPNNP